MRDPITWQVRKINTLGPTGPARNVGGKLFRSVTLMVEFDRFRGLFAVYFHFKTAIVYFARIK